jgi:peptidoglycan/xylan/chitin deacetylase (PgdA/CDA1 family)
MRLKQVWQTFNAILLAINLTLGALTLAALGYCGYLVYRISDLPQTDPRVAISNLQETIAQLQTDIQERTREVAQAEEAGMAAVEQAQAALALVQAEYDGVALEHSELRMQVNAFENSAALQEDLKLEIARIRKEYGKATRTLEDMILAGESDYKICYLTFDDGPSYPTPEFLDLIDKLDIRVTFFTIGVQMLEADAKLREELLRREALGGHSIANHTYTHGIYSNLYDDLEIFMDSVKKQDDLVYRVAGFHPDIFRFPAGSYYCPFREAAIAELEKIGYGWIDWIGNAYDSGFPAKSSESVYNNVVWQVRQDKVTVELMHDWRTETLGALRRIVETLQAENYLFLPLFKESSTVGTAKPRWG